MKRVTTPRVVIAAPSSGSGKSTIASGLMAALAKTDVVQGYKVGPDYIDPGYHSLASGRISRNLDTWMLPEYEVKASFGRGVQGADIAVVEGVMGLYDGYDGETERGSTAELAKMIGAPVLLVINAAKMARSAGAVALGYRDFDPELNLAGVICNNVGSEKHALWVRQAIEGKGIKVLGCMPRSSSLHIPERHLGLHTAVERTAEVEAFLSQAAELVSTHIDLGQVWEIARKAAPVDTPDDRLAPSQAVTRIAVARDAAFCFYYEDNFDLLRAAGAEIVFFSPLHDAGLPEGVSGLYLGGGYPELYAARLVENGEMMASLRQAIAAGLPTYAECGGLMYLTGSITDLEEQVYPMLGILPGRAQMVGRLTMGYREVHAVQDSLLFGAGDTFRGHEFHYSDWLERPEDVPYAYTVQSRLRQEVHWEGYRRGNLLASYIHVHFGTRPELAENFVATCAQFAL